MEGIKLNIREDWFLMSEDATLYLTLDEVDDLFEDYSVVDSLESGAQGFVFKVKREDDFILIDLGIAKHHDLSTITKTGMAVGTPVYMSPEQLAARKNITLKSDLFSLGIVLYEAYTGQHPYGFEYTMIGRINPTPIKSARLNYDNKIANIINYLLKTRSIT